MEAMHYEKLVEIVLALQGMLRRHLTAQASSKKAPKPNGAIAVMMLEETFSFLFPGSGSERCKNGSFRAVTVSTTHFFGVLARVSPSPYRLVGKDGACAYVRGPIKASLSAKAKLVSYDHSNCPRCMYNGTLAGPYVGCLLLFKTRVPIARKTLLDSLSFVPYCRVSSTCGGRRQACTLQTRRDDNAFPRPYVYDPSSNRVYVFRPHSAPDSRSASLTHFCGVSELTVTLCGLLVYDS